ncbi:MAG: 3-isopropylmalate dehydratase small subunit [Acidimicrobiales bacterium]|nr:3-isopropylmalate dehydratase small subunit [Acidimicrobiales bacterium]|tara:strand:- start:2888 stop:3481 length:594 start_codon:yes stop_codon:yes gene_type:complete
MQAVRVHEGNAVPLDRSDVDTDQIIPSDWLKRVERTGFGKGLFSEWRDERDFILNDENYAGASILVAGSNFGTGSSREHAVWALMDYGFMAVISPRFGDIFRNNATKNGLIPCQISEEGASKLREALHADPDLSVTVDVERLKVLVPAIGLDEDFPMDDATRERFLEGLDDIGITLRSQGSIESYESNRAAWLPDTN